MKPAATVRMTNDGYPSRSMTDNNIIPFPRNLREFIKTEMNLAFMKYGHNNLEILMIQHSWGETMSDVEVLLALRKINESGCMFDHITRRDER